MRILIIEDEIQLADALSVILGRNNYIADCAYDGELGLELALRDVYDAIILDIMLPKLNGIDVLKTLK